MYPEENELQDFSELRYLGGLAIYAAEHGAELNYIAGTNVSDLSAKHLISLSPGAQLGVSLGWNYLDGVFAIMLGVRQLMDQDDFRQKQLKAKAVLNIISGVQLFVLSYNPAITVALGLTGGAALASPSFALAMLCDLVGASIDYYNAYKEASFEGWLEERVQEVNFVEKKIAQGLEKNDDVSSLASRKNRLLNQIESRSRVFYHKQIKNGEKEHLVAKKLDKELDQLSLRNSISYRVAPTAEDFKINNEIEKTCKENHVRQLKNLSVKALSFVGMTLFAIAPFIAASACPPVLIAGLAITSVVAAYYLYRNSEFVFSKVRSVGNAIHGFFSKQFNEPVMKCTPSTVGCRA